MLLIPESMTNGTKFKGHSILKILLHITPETFYNLHFHQQ